MIIPRCLSMHAGNGRVQRVKCVKLDAAKKPIAGTEFTIDADLVLLAIGQSKLGAMLGSLSGITIDKGIIKVDTNGFTGRAKWYAGGDCTNGGKEVVEGAIARDIVSMVSDVLSDIMVGGAGQ